MFRGEAKREEKLDEAHKALKLTEEFLQKNTYVAGDHLTLGGLYSYVAWLQVF